MAVVRAIHNALSIMLRAGMFCVMIGLHFNARAERILAETFFANPVIDKVELSPNGRYLAVQMARKDGRVMLATMDIESRSPHVIANYSDADVVFFRWVNDDRLIFRVSDKQNTAGDYRFTSSGLIAIKRDGTGYRPLGGGGFFATTSMQDSDDIFVYGTGYTIKWDANRVELWRLNTATGQSKSFRRPGLSQDWLIDHQNIPRANVTIENARETLYYKDHADADWRKIHEADIYSEDTIEPAYFAPDGTLYVVARKGRDKTALYTFDVKNNRLGTEPVLSLAGYDFRGSFVHDANKLLGIRYATDAAATIWFDERMKQIQKQVDELLPATVNRVSTSVRNETPYVLVASYSDVDPGSYFLYHTENHKLDLIGRPYPAIDPRQMATMDMVHIKARDGLDIPAYLTLPTAQTKNLPLVVLVHGGPWQRGAQWEWNPEVQFLASRGYAVIQPEFRGSTGFGFKHFKAGWKQWGLAMQDDLADAAKWAIAQGVADPKRICIAGASYGGYATLMGLIKDPEVFKCGINWIGVTDIDLMYSATWSDSTEDWKKYGMPVLIGDREKDAEQLNATSPVKQAARLRQPLLMAYGTSDYRVPAAHGVQMRDALKPVNPNVEWIEYSREGHGWKLVKNRVDFWSRVEQFLDRNIGK